MAIDRRRLLGLSLAAGAGLPAMAAVPSAPLLGATDEPDEVIDLWPAGPPGVPHVPLTDTLIERSSDPALRDRARLGISRPQLALFRPAQPDGRSVMITPGGGYKWVVVDKEGYELGRWLAARGVTAFVLFYRLPGEGWSAGPDVVLQDTQRAIRLIRHRAARYRIDPAHVGSLGFSAGGHACADLAARWSQQVYDPVDAIDRELARPAFAAPIYPVISMMPPHAHPGSRERLLGPDPSVAQMTRHSPHLAVTGDAPPHFILHAQDDASVPVRNATLLHEALSARAISSDLHLFAHGGHGFGLRKTAGKPVAIWPELFLAWLRAVTGLAQTAPSG